MKQVNWTRILTILLVILAAYAVLYVTGTVLSRFRHVIFIFVLGALTAYVLYPLVKRLEVLLRVRWLAILTSYIILAAGLFTLGVFLFTPFIQQSQSLVDNLQNPSSGSLQNFVTLECRARQVERDLRTQTQPAVCAGVPLAPGDAAAVRVDIDSLQLALTDLRAGIITGHAHVRIVGPVTPGRQPPNPPDQTDVPSSYVKPIATQITDLVNSYDAAQTVTGDAASSAIAQAIAHARKAEAAAKSTYTIMSNTPILLIRSQSWLDDHGIQINIHDKFGDAATQLSNQGTLILNNAVTIVQTTANGLLNTALILIIAFYLLIDGARLINRGVTLVPSAYRDQVWYFVSSLDRVLGGYIRGQLFLSALAGLLGGAGAAALGVPYPLLIGILTFILETIPVIGPMVALFPGVLGLPILRAGAHDGTALRLEHALPAARHQHPGPASDGHRGGHSSARGDGGGAVGLPHCRLPRRLPGGAGGGNSPYCGARTVCLFRPRAGATDGASRHPGTRAGLDRRFAGSRPQNLWCQSRGELSVPRRVLCYAGVAGTLRCR